MSEKTYEIDLSLGFKPFQIKFKEFPEPVTIYFNPADSDLPKRLFEIKKTIDEEAKKIGEYELDENGIPKTDDVIEKTQAMNQLIYDNIDYAFGNKISDKLFMHCSPFALTNGEVFILQFLDRITPVLEEIVKKEKKAANDNVNKYLNKYMKKAVKKKR